MNIKSLLIGSAAALTAVSGAQAADAVVAAEPEPVEYVRVCDAYGAGYFYIPGTETCLRISGYVRFDAGAGDLLGKRSFDVKDLAEGELNENDTWNLRTRFTLRTHTASETELGTLRTYTETRFQYDSNSVDYNIVDGDGNTIATSERTEAGFDDASLNFAYVELGGLRIGKDETAFRTFVGYAGNVILDDQLDGAGYDTMLISYTFTGKNGFSAILSLEQGDDEHTIDSYLPHVVGGLKYAQGWGSIAAVAAYDANVEEWAAKARVDLNVNDAFSVFVMGAYQSEGDIANYRENYYGTWGGDWIGWVGASYKLNDKATFNAQVSYDESEALGASANVAYKLVPGFTITPEVAYYKNSDDLSGNDDDAWGGMIRFQRSF
ncbi:porin [Phyllobacterium leguminum]|uniref:Porin n=1 Tax=Phyllobacterium leguminum TaxID=314237 RepID=A0A318T685_9HYPH|nr:porin [Phyllobacterium leguminum]PYE88439.1 porin-like protein [Phyllobacterium leguminum]